MDWREAVELLERRGERDLPSLGEADWERVASGGLVERRQPRGELDGAAGIGWLDRAPAAVWVAILDDEHDDLVRHLVEARLPGSTPALEILYQRLDLPFPFHDRHWVIGIWSEAGLFRASGGRAWVRRWELDARGPAALADLPAPLAAGARGAVWTPANSGSWLLVPSQGGVLVLYRVRTDVGGIVPPELVLRYTLATLDELFSHVGELAARALLHYGSRHRPIPGPDGRPLPPFDQVAP